MIFEGLSLAAVFLLVLGWALLRLRVRRQAPEGPDPPGPEWEEFLAREILQLFADSVVLSAEQAFLASGSFKKDMAVRILRALLAERQLPVPPAPEEALERARHRLKTLTTQPSDPNPAQPFPREVKGHASGDFSRLSRPSP